MYCNIYNSKTYVFMFWVVFPQFLQVKFFKIPCIFMKYQIQSLTRLFCINFLTPGQKIFLKKRNKTLHKSNLKLNTNLHLVKVEWTLNILIIIVFTISTQLIFFRTFSLFFGRRSVIITNLKINLGFCIEIILIFLLLDKTHICFTLIEVQRKIFKILSYLYSKR